MRGIGKCLMVFVMLLAAVPVECRATQPAPVPTPAKEPVTVSQECSAKCGSDATDLEEYNECVANCEIQSRTNLPPSATIAPSAIP